MKITINLIAIILLAISNSCTSAESRIVHKNNSSQNALIIISPTPKLENLVWKPAVFKGIKIGQDSRSKVLEILGRPTSSVISDNNDKPINSKSADAEIIDTYEDIGLYGKVIVISSKKNEIVIEIESNPKNFTIEEAIKFFGNDYRKVQYDLIVCSNDAGSSAIYESRNGEFKYLEYRAKGIAFETDSDEKYVKNILFVSEPIGLTSPTCSK